MKACIISSFLAAAVSGLALGAETAYTTPVGYTTQTLAANTFTLVGFNVLTSTLAAGTLTGVSGNTLTDSSADFTTALPAGKTCILEITSGTLLAPGTVQEFVTWTGTTITVPSALTDVAVGNTYKIRVAPTVQEVFPVGFLAGSVLPTTADKIWVPTATAGTYIKYWYKTNAPIGWHTTTTGSNDTGLVSGDIPLISVDGILIEKKATAKDLVLTGEVKKTGSNYVIGTGFNLVSVNPPAGLTLFTAGLQGDIAGSVLVTTADIVWVPSGPGTYNKYWYKTNAPIGWHTTTTGSDDTGLVTVDPSLAPSIYIQRKGAAKVVSFNVPTSYSGL